MGKSLLSAAMAIAVLATPSGASAQNLNLLIWEAYIDPAILSAWTEKTGITVQQTYYDSGDVRDEILSDPDNDVDLVVTGENGAKLFGNRGVLTPMTVDNEPSLKDYSQEWSSRCGGYGVPYLWGTMGILYRSDKISVTPTSWADLMRPKTELKGHIAMYEDHNEAFVAPLVLLGKSINANDNETLKAAYEVMKTQSPFVLTYDYVITSIQNANQGPNIYMAIGYSGDQHVLNEKVGQPGLWRYAVPKEGTLSWLDCMSVNERSRRKELALQLVDFIANAENSARNAITLNMPTANSAALSKIPAEMRDNPEIYPPSEILARSQTQEELTVQSVQARRRIISSLVQFRDPR
ncbi:spermidine/putrescine ABC transporter substrate-binding protein [Sinorhizobium sp. BG8]|uniref:polyamine ABC transporter substrate-binding protein n=1 Tax=Sinorhizobium sp. BG8 TaxID=2613773 RepID=UPI00193D780B|nr:spermidine/putrescine ABC transporter substrate-binding protein [Sinorhizobium sp. BG8]QRM54821.1 spermidine/putrescine ABC transporter substrate-binding protein [Sinorhizobium sp. BG8]